MSEHCHGSGRVGVGAGFFERVIAALAPTDPSFQARMWETVLPVQDRLVRRAPRQGFPARSATEPDHCAHLHCTLTQSAGWRSARDAVCFERYGALGLAKRRFCDSHMSARGEHNEG